MKTPSKTETKVEINTAIEDDKAITPTKRALVMAINDYQGDVNDLPSCVNDADAFEGYLKTKLGFSEIQKFTDSKATIQNFKTGLSWLFKGAKAGDNLVFFYSGHGFQQPVSGTLEEYLVLYDGLLQDDELSKQTQSLPDGVLTVVLDSCFSGGLEKALFLATILGADSVQRTRIKCYMPSRKELKSIVMDETSTLIHRPFGCAPVMRSSGNMALMSKVAGNEEGQLQMKGLLISACSEDETAAASTPLTNGMSAFTYSILKVVAEKGSNISSRSLALEATQKLRAIGISQTPLVKEPKTPGGLGDKAFLTFQTPAVKSQSNIEDVLAALLGGSPKFGFADILPYIPAIIEAVKKTSPGVDEKSLVGDIIRIAGAVVKSPEQQKLFGIDDAILIPAIASVVAAAISKNQKCPPWFDAFGLGLPHYSSQGGTIIDRQKLFGIDDAILIPAIVSVVTAAIKKGQPADEKSLLGDVIRAAGTVVKEPQEKFGFTDIIPYIPAIIEAVKKSSPGMDEKSLVGDIIRIAGAVVKSPEQQKLFGIDDAILIPAIVSVVTAAIKKGQPAEEKSLLGDIIRAAGTVVKSPQEKFGFMEILPYIPAIIEAVKKSSPSVDEKSLVGDIIRIAGAVVKSPEQQKLFGIDDAILIPAIASVVAAAIKKGQPDDEKSLLGDIIRTAGAVVKSPEQQKLFGIDDAILIPAIVSIVTAAIKKGQPADEKSLLGDIIRAAGAVVKEPQEKFGFADIIPYIPIIIEAVKKQHQEKIVDCFPNPIDHWLQPRI